MKQRKVSRESKLVTKKVLSSPLTNIVSNNAFTDNLSIPEKKKISANNLIKSTKKLAKHRISSFDILMFQNDTNLNKNHNPQNQSSQNKLSIKKSKNDIIYAPEQNINQNNKDLKRYSQYVKLGASPITNPAESKLSNQGQQYKLKSMNYNNNIANTKFTSVLSNSFYDEILETFKKENEKIGKKKSFKKKVVKKVSQNNIISEKENNNEKHTNNLNGTNEVILPKVNTIDFSKNEQNIFNSNVDNETKENNDQPAIEVSKKGINIKSMFKNFLKPHQLISEDNTSNKDEVEEINNENPLSFFKSLATANSNANNNSEVKHAKKMSFMEKLRQKKKSKETLNNKTLFSINSLNDGESNLKSKVSINPRKKIDPQFLNINHLKSASIKELNKESIEDDLNRDIDEDKISFKPKKKFKLFCCF